MTNIAIKLAAKEKELGKHSSPLMGEEETMFFSSLSLRQFFDYILIRASELIVQNRNSFPDFEKEKIDFIESSFPPFSSMTILNKINDDVFEKVASNISYLHDKYVWNYFVTEKGRKVYSLKDSFLFMKEVHFLFSLVRGKVLDDDLSDVFDLGRNEKVFVKKEGKRTRIIKQNRPVRINPETRSLVLGSSIYGNSFVKSFRGNLEITKTKLISNFNSRCSFGVKGGVYDAVLCHSRPDNMVTFDISKFFPSFTSEKIRENRLFEKIYEIIVENSKDYLNKKEHDKFITPEVVYDNANIFYYLFDAFSYKGILPTGSVFASAISNLLFFSIDSKIKILLDSLKLENEKYIRELIVSAEEDRNVRGLSSPEFMSFGSSYFWERGPSNPLGKNPYVYTRYVDDIAISINFDLVIQASKAVGRAIYKELDITKFFINLNLVKQIEKILNEEGFHIKYEKTKVFSYKMDKSYLGFVYHLSNWDFKADRGLDKENLNLFLKERFQTLRYSINVNSKSRNLFERKFFNYDSLDELERERLKGYYSYLVGFEKKINGSRLYANSRLVINNPINSSGSRCSQVFKINEKKFPFNVKVRDMKGVRKKVLHGN